MTNFEKHKEYLLKCGIGMCAVINGKPAECGFGACKECDFGNAEECDIDRTKWLYEEAGEKPIDWREVPIDTKVIIERHGIKHKRYFAGVDENGVPCYFIGGQSSWSSETTPNVLDEQLESISLAEEL